MTKTSALHQVVFAAVLSLCGYSGHIKFIQDAHAASATQTPIEGKALIVFVRTSSDATQLNYLSSPVFEIKNGSSEPELVGILREKTKIAYPLDPGKHLFMAVDEIADFMTAEVLPNMTYYVLVLARPGNRRPIYSLKAVDKREQNSKEFRELIASSKWVEKTADSLNWAAKMSNKVAIASKQQRDYEPWISKPESERSRLLPNDGVGGHAQSPEGGASASAVIQVQPAVQTTEEKLKELKRLNDAGLISKEVYLEQQRAILSKP